MSNSSTRITLGGLQIAFALVAIVSVIALLASTMIAIAINAETAKNYLSLTELVLSWPVAAGGLVFGGGSRLIRAFNESRPNSDRVRRRVEGQ